MIKFQLIYIPEFSTFFVLAEGDINDGVPFVVDIDDKAMDWYLDIWLCKSSIFLSYNIYRWYVK